MANILNTLKTAITKGEIYVMPNGKTVSAEYLKKSYRKDYIAALKCGEISEKTSMQDIFELKLALEVQTIDLYNAIREVLNTPEDENNEPQEEKENVAGNEDAESAANPGDTEPAESTETAV